jgi:hypothetical protein
MMLSIARHSGNVLFVTRIPQIRFVNSSRSQLLLHQVVKGELIFQDHFGVLSVPRLDNRHGAQLALRSSPDVGV